MNTDSADLSASGPQRRASESPFALLKLMQLSSSGLPVGGFSYSQGLEWAVEAGWLCTADSLLLWLREQLCGQIAQQDLPILLQLYRACENPDQAVKTEAIEYWSRLAIALRETAELRAEERNRGRAMASVLNSIGGDERIPANCQHAAWAAYCVREGIPVSLALDGFAFAWLENQVMAGIKLVPLGQTDGQRIIYALLADISLAVEVAQDLPIDEIGYSSPSLAMASSLHETQYCRLFRS